MVLGVLLDVNPSEPFGTLNTEGVARAASDCEVQPLRANGTSITACAIRMLCASLAVVLFTYVRKPVEWSMIGVVGLYEGSAFHVRIRCAQHHERYAKGLASRAGHDSGRGSHRHAMRISDSG